jgi:transposase
LEDSISDRRNHLLEFLLPALSRSHSQPADHRVSHGLPAHRSRAVWDFVRQQRGRIWLEFLPAYAPELNPTEYIWGHLKQHEIANLCPKNLSELSLQAVRALKRMRRRPTLVMAFWQQAKLFPV